MMFKKIICSILIGLVVCVVTSCGAPKLEDKTEKADYAKMQSKQFNAKYTYLKEVTPIADIKSDLYPNNKAMSVFEKGTSNGYIIVVTDCDKDSVIKSRMGSELRDYTININKAEVVPESLGSKKTYPILLAKQADIEMIEETKFEEILKSGKPYEEIPGIFSYMMMMKDGKLNYDKEKYSQRVEELLKGYESESAELGKQVQEEEKARENTPQTVTSNYKAKCGELLQASQLGRTLTVKFKIDNLGSNTLTIAQNGINVEDLIVNQGASQFDTIEYLAVADMKDGSEDKVTSFTVDKELIKSVKNREIIGKQIVDRAKNTWILPSLKE